MSYRVKLQVHFGFAKLDYMIKNCLCLENDCDERKKEKILREIFVRSYCEKKLPMHKARRIREKFRDSRRNSFLYGNRANDIQCFDSHRVINYTKGPK